jgi:predicted MFS family arabinose efflux permease
LASRAFALACVVEAIGVLASIAWQATAGVFAVAVLVGGTFMALTALGLMRGRELARHDARRVLALMTSAFGIGQIVGPYFAGLVSDWLGSFTVPSVAAAAGLLIAALLAK